MKVVISSGHGKLINGAVDILDEHKEAVRVVNKTAEFLRAMGVEVKTFEDTTSTTQDQNLHTIVNYHNAQTRELDVSIHFNAYEHTSKPMGTECLYVTQSDLADQVAEELAGAGGFIDRGPKKRTDLFFLNQTEEPAILVEVCFVDSEADANLYQRNFENICEALASVISGRDISPIPPEPVPGGFWAKGACSWFGGPEDNGVSPSEGLAFLYTYEDAPHLFLKSQPPGTTGLARRLNPGLFYVACRWDYNSTSKAQLSDASRQALVRANGKEFLAWPADWGPQQDTGRVADLSPGLLNALGLQTDDEVEVIYPAEEPDIG